MATFDELRAELEPVLANWIQCRVDRETVPLERELQAAKYENAQLRAALDRADKPLEEE